MLPPTLHPFQRVAERPEFVVRAVRLDRRTVARFVGSRADPGESTPGVRLYRLRHGGWTGTAPSYVSSGFGYPDRYRVVPMKHRRYRLVIGEVLTRENYFCIVFLFDTRRVSLSCLGKDLLNVDASQARTGVIREVANAKWISPRPTHDPVERIWRIDPARGTIRAGDWHAIK